jgi:hypothetical protein
MHPALLGSVDGCAQEEYEKKRVREGRLALLPAGEVSAGSLPALPLAKTANLINQRARILGVQRRRFSFTYCSAPARPISLFPSASAPVQVFDKRCQKTNFKASASSRLRPPQLFSS